MARIGFIGLGVMGGAMARNLIAAGHDLTVFDLDDAAMESAVEAGADAAESNAGAISGAEVVFFSLPAPGVVEMVVEKAADAFDPGTVLVDTTTSTPDTTQGIAERLADQDVSVIGAPVSGGARGAEKATLTIMAGGDPAVYEACESLFETIGSDVYHVGELPGHGHAVKLLNNYLSFTSLLATSEAVILGRAAGLDPETLVDVFNVSTGRNSATDDKFPNDILTGEFENGFKIGLMDKDMKLLSQFSDDQDVPLLIGSVVENLITHTRLREGPEEDQTRAYTVLEDMMRP